MRFILLTLATPCLLISCIPESNKPQNEQTESETAPEIESTSAAPIYAASGYPPPSQTAPTRGLVHERLQTQEDRIGRLETELHAMRLLFTDQLKRIEEVANRPAQHLPATAYRQPQTQQPQQVVIMPNNPVVTHRWDQAPTGATANNYSSTYRIKSGDTLSQIAQTYGLPTHAIITANPGTNPLRLQVGSQLTIPSAAQANQYIAQARTRARSYTVQAGDTLSQIAEHYGVGLSQVIAANPGLNPDRIRIGKILQIPSARTAPTPVRQAHPQPSGYASPPLRSIQREPQTTPQSSLTPQYKSAPAQEAPKEPTHKMLIKVEQTTTYGEIARKMGTDVDTLNRLNHCSLSASSPIRTNGTIFVPAR